MFHAISTWTFQILEWPHFSWNLMKFHQFLKSTEGRMFWTFSSSMTNCTVLDSTFVLEMSWNSSFWALLALKVPTSPKLSKNLLNFGVNLLTCEFALWIRKNSYPVSEFASANSLVNSNEFAKRILTEFAYRNWIHKCEFSFEFNLNSLKADSDEFASRKRIALQFAWRTRIAVRFAYRPRLKSRLAFRNWIHEFHEISWIFMVFSLEWLHISRHKGLKGLCLVNF